MTVYKEYDQYGYGTRKLLSGDTTGNKKTMDQGKVPTDPTYCHPQHTGPNGFTRRHGWNGEWRERSPEGVKDY